MEMTVLAGIFAATLLLLSAFMVMACAHCDTMDGPTAKDGKKALDAKNMNYASKWILPEFETELREIFLLSLKVRELGPEAKELADRYFLENLVRIHRAGEGAPFEGLKPSGTPIDEKIRAADESIVRGDLSPLEGIIPAERFPELRERFDTAMSLKNFDPDDVAAGRKYIAAYVRFFKFAEGEEHEHMHGHGEGHMLERTHEHAGEHGHPHSLEEYGHN